MKEGYVDIKISTLVKKMDKYLKERKIPELQDKEFEQDNGYKNG